IRSDLVTGVQTCALPISVAEIELHAEPEPLELMEPTAAALASEPEFEGEFDVNRLSPEEQELHRRANRVAKVSMQDIKMLRPERSEERRVGKEGRGERGP